MSVSSLEDPSNPTASGGPYMLSCPYCHWSTVEIGIELDKATGITSQLSRIANGGRPIPSQKEREKEREKQLQASHRKSRDILSGSDDSPTTAKEMDAASISHEERFDNLAAFYKSQIAAQTPANPFSPGGDMTFSSPSSYSRLMNLYATTSSKKGKRDKPAPMREGASPLEGLTIHSPTSDAEAIERIKKEGWASTLSPSQKTNQVPISMNGCSVKFAEDLRPIPQLLQTKRGKRCRTCRHILSKPESKVTSTRYKIKLLSLNHIPRLSIRALNPTPAAPTSSTTSTAPAPATATAFDYANLRPGIPTPFLLHLSNPLFDSIRVTLATSSTTPGRIPSQVTIMCPQFEVGANTDVWDDALAGGQLTPIKRGGKSISGLGEREGGGARGGAGGAGGEGTEGGFEAGKIWERGRNWTSVIIEVVPGFTRPILPGGGNAKEEDELDEDDDLLEIPIFVRIEYETDANAEDRGLGDSRGSKGEKVAREEAFWTVVGVGRIAGI